MTLFLLLLELLKNNGWERITSLCHRSCSYTSNTGCVWQPRGRSCPLEFCIGVSKSENKSLLQGASSNTGGSCPLEFLARMCGVEHKLTLFQTKYIVSGPFSCLILGPIPLPISGQNGSKQTFRATPIYLDHSLFQFIHSQYLPLRGLGGQHNSA